jgi:N-glycosidase YbiA
MKNNTKTSRLFWGEYALHDEYNIKGFFDKFRYLSNFHICDIWFEGKLYPSSEHAFQAAKCINIQDRNKFVKIPDAEGNHWGVTCADAKRLGKIVALNPNWDNIKYDVMSSICFEKFYRHKELRDRLVNTWDKYLEETNAWGDVYYGVDIHRGGQNNLGKILMKIRDFWK